MRINLETAKLAKEKGYDESCSSVFVDGNPKELGGVQRKNSTYQNQITRPTQSDLQKWLREVHDIHVNPNHSYTISLISLGYNLSVDSGKYKYSGKFIYGDSYEEVLELGLQDGLKQIKQDEDRS